MQFDPTIRLDFVTTAGVILFFVARLQSQVVANSRDISRTGYVLEKIENRVRESEIKISGHLGEQTGEERRDRRAGDHA